jgi:hypothetical protein
MDLPPAGVSLESDPISSPETNLVLPTLALALATREVDSIRMGASRSGKGLAPGIKIASPAFKVAVDSILFCLRIASASALYREAIFLMSSPFFTVYVTPSTGGTTNFCPIFSVEVAFKPFSHKTVLVFKLYSSAIVEIVSPDCTSSIQNVNHPNLASEFNRGSASFTSNHHGSEQNPYRFSGNMQQIDNSQVQGSVAKQINSNQQVINDAKVNNSNFGQEIAKKINERWAKLKKCYENSCHLFHRQ